MSETFNLIIYPISYYSYSYHLFRFCQFKFAPFQYIISHSCCAPIFLESLNSPKSVYCCQIFLPESREYKIVITYKAKEKSHLTHS